MENLMRNLQDIFMNPEIDCLEKKIVFLQMRIEMRYDNTNDNIALIKKTLSERKCLLDRNFKMDEGYKELLCEFNNSLGSHLIQMREELIKGYEAIRPYNINGEIEAIGKCFLDCPFPNNEQERLVTDALRHYNIHYESGVTGTLGWRYNPADKEKSSENYLLYLGDDRDNWNDWFVNKEMTKDMNIIHAVHHLLDHTYFSIFDLLQIREFNIDITVTSLNSTKDPGKKELDWTKRDYLD